MRNSSIFWRPTSGRNAKAYLSFRVLVKDTPLWYTICNGINGVSRFFHTKRSGNVRGDTKLLEKGVIMQVNTFGCAVNHGGRHQPLPLLQGGNTWERQAEILLSRGSVKGPPGTPPVQTKRKKPAPTCHQGDCPLMIHTTGVLNKKVIKTRAKGTICTGCD